MMIEGSARGEGDATRVSFAVDLFIFVLIGAVAAGVSFVLGAQLAPVLYIDVDLYYGADINRVFDYMTGGGRFAQFRSTVHPVFTFLLFPPTRSLMGVGLSPEQAAQAVVALSAAATASILYLSARLLELCRVDAILLCLMFIGSATFVFWWSVPETFPFGGMSVAIALMMPILSRTSLLAWVLASSFALAITTTNIAAALIASAFRLGRFNTLKVALLATTLVAVLAVWQKAYLPTSQFFFLPGAFTDELSFVSVVNEVGWSLGFGGNLASFWLAPWVAPDSIMTEAQGIRPVHLSYGVAGWVALVALLVVFVAAIAALRQEGRLRRLALIPGLFIGFQFMLHMVYGDEPFLYAAHFLPAFMVVLALGFLGPLATLCRIAALIFALVAPLNNVPLFLEANELLVVPT
ncbi:hypothetical protein [Paracoccus tibetensis]|uniref:Dolichyl-phosphate-mannose-protein mannosyltransferase n=1 Tax=Paracoccus tibetensis TaxID=336292 RepID=A0A1G5FW61_9RHOB|nr:hypothetical protein [Paracoccus tibetensis]SCY43377.1 hypothetical protein SAMN05660710_01591 [Paracoccus tibetensis]